MPPSFPSLLPLILLMVGPAQLTSPPSQGLKVRGQRTARDSSQDSIKVVISEGCATQGDSSDGNQGGREIDLVPGAPLVLTHKIKLVPSGSGPGQCGCETDFAALQERLERLEREVSALREKCGGAEGGCCTSKESKGAGCSIKPDIDECPNECSDQGRCVDGKCVCFPGFGGPDCSDSNCPGNCNDNGRCVNGQCVCDPGFSGSGCLQTGCPDNCNDRGKCVNGECVCDGGYTGSSCSDDTCPGNCNDRGKCVNGECVCNAGFTGPDCSTKACPNNCNNRGRCVNGKCECNSGFNGVDCSEESCPGNCNSRGRCVNGQCICDDGFSGSDCSQKDCPGNCSNRGKCENGNCVCNVGFTGPDCAAKGCTNNCNNKGRCVKGKCVCRRGFTGADCSQCMEGMTGHNCDTPMSAVSQLSTRDITETSVTLFWTPPPVQYETYHITFTSQKEKDQQITVQVEGSLTTFTQTGLAAGQEYSTSITGEIGGRRGAESSSEFTTLLSGPSNLHVVKTTSTSVVVQWEPSQGEIDRYRMTVLPNDGAGTSQELTFPPHRDSANIQQLEAGRLYDIILVAEKDSSRSEPATTQGVPANPLPKVSMATVAKQVTPSLGQDVVAKDRELILSPEIQVVDQQEDGSEAKPVKVGGVIGINEDPSATVIARTKPSGIRKDDTGNTKFTERPVLSRKPNAPTFLRWNATRVAPGGRTVDPRPLKKLPGGEKKKAPIAARKPKPESPKLGNRTMALTVKEPIVEALSAEREAHEYQASMSGTDSGTNGQSSSDEPTIPFDSREKPDVVTEGQGSTEAPSSEPTGVSQSHKKKCMKKIKLTHIRLPKKDGSSGCTGHGTVLEGRPTSDSHQGPSENNTVPLTPDAPPCASESSSAENDPLHKLLTDTFNNLNITAFSVQLSESSDLSLDEETVNKQSLRKLEPLPSPSFSSSSPSSSQSAAASSSMSSSSSVEIMTPSSTPRTAPSSSSSSPSSPPSSSSSERPHSVPLGDDDDAASTREGKVPSREDSIPLFRRTPPKGGSIRHSRPNLGPFRNRTHLNSRAPYHSSFPLKLIPRKDTETRHNSMSELSSLPSSSASAESSSVEVNAALGGTGEDKDGATTLTSSGVEQNQKRILTERGRLPVRRLSPNMHRPLSNLGPFQNRTRPNVRLLARPPPPLRPDTDTQRESVTSSPVSEESPRVDRAGSAVEETEDGVKANMSDETKVPSSQHPTSKVGHTQLFVGPFKNRTRPNLRPLKPPHRLPMRKPSPTRNINGGGGIAVGRQTSQLAKEHPLETLNKQSGVQDVNSLTQEVGIRQAGDQGTAERIQGVQARDHDTPKEDNTPYSNSDLNSHEERVNANKNIGGAVRGRPITKQTNSRPVTLPKTKPQIRRITAQGDTQRMEQDPKHTRTGDSKSLMESDIPSSGVTREPLGYVGVTNRTSDGFRVTWDAPEGKYKNFVVTSKEVSKGDKLDEKELKHQPTKETDGSPENENRVPESVTPIPSIQSTTEVNPAKESDKTFKKVVPGSARSFQFEDLPPQTEYTVTLLGKGPGLLSRLHKLVISTGPEPPSNIEFSKVTENSLTVSWTKPKSPVSGFKVTYINTDDGEPVSASVDWENSTLGLSQLSPGSSYEVSVVSILDLDESDPIKDFVMTRPDPPTNLRAINVTDSQALLLWRPALATVDKYDIVYGSGKGAELRITVSGNAAEQQLSGLEGSTTYTVTITSQLGSVESSPATSSFTTSGGSGGGGDPPRDLQASRVTPRTALLSWKPPTTPVGSYKLTYQTEGQEAKEVIVDATVTEYNLTRLHPGAKYTVKLQGAEGGSYTAAVSTEFTTGTLRFPFPTDCSQELLNGIRISDEVEIFPQGKDGMPVMVYCDMETDGGGWTVFQRRKDGSVDFFRGWKEYMKGFGDLSGEFWLGLDGLHNLTTMTKMNLRVDLRDGDESVFAKYSTFEVAKRNYRLTVGGYSGTAGDSLSYHNNRFFSTKDRDPAPFITRCAMSYRGGWWYKNCHEANLNGVYGIDVKHQGVIWTSWKGKDFSIAFTEMKMRPAAFSPPSRGG